jgi:AcrR family transcriptional regulator
MKDAEKTERRRYDSPLRRKRARETRERIIAAGADLLHDFAVWNWRALTVRAVAKRAGVNERTVYRHFANERELREAVLARQQEEARVEIEKLDLDHLREVATRILAYMSTFPIEQRKVLDPTLEAAGRLQRESLLGAVAPHTEEWDERDRALAAALLDVQWGLAAYERIVADWGLDPDDAIRGIIWVQGLIEEAIRNGRRPDGD